MTTRSRLSSKVALSSDIAEFRFESLGASYGGIEPGAHVDVHLGNGLIRQYSLCDWDPEGSWLAVAVKREAEGRGGSRAMHALEVGADVEIGGPRNHFALKERSGPILLIGGGIGATPILAMARQLAAENVPFNVLYLARTRDDAALHAAFESLDLGDAYDLHCDAEAGFYDIAGLMRRQPVEGHVYVCGPEPLLKALLTAGEEFGLPNIHYERFAAVPIENAEPAHDFQVEIKSTGKIYDVGAGQTILDILKGAKLNVEFGCSEGICGSCIVNVLEGEVDHRDSVLQGAEREQNDYMCICVSRARSKRLVLDF